MDVSFRFTHGPAVIYRLDLSPLPDTSGTNLQWCHFLMAPPPPVSKLSNKLCTRARSQTLKDIGRLCWARQHGAPSNLDLFGCWHHRRDSDGCQMSWNMPAEYTRRHHHYRPCPHLVYLGTFWIWWEKNNQLRIRVKCQTAYLCLNE